MPTLADCKPTFEVLESKILLRTYDLLNLSVFKKRLAVDQAILRGLGALCLVPGNI